MVSTQALRLFPIDWQCLHPLTKYHIAIYKRQSLPTLWSQNERRFAYRCSDCFVALALHECHESYVSPDRRSSWHGADSVRAHQTHSNNNRQGILYAKHCIPANIYDNSINRRHKFRECRCFEL